MTMDRIPENVNPCAAGTAPETTAGGNGPTVTKLPYAMWAGRLIANGYSPVPTRPDNAKAPIEADWTKYTHEFKVRGHEIKRSNGRKDILPFDGYLGVACGINSLLAIDIDVDDSAAVFNEIIRPLLAKFDDDDEGRTKNYWSPVQKRGNKGKTLYYRVAGTEGEQALIVPHNAPNPKYDPKRKASDSEYDEPKYIFEIKWKGQHTTIPPSVHPNTSKEYVWCGEKDEYGEYKSLYNTRIDQLPVLSIEQAKALCSYNSKPRDNTSGARKPLSKVIEEIPVEYEGLRCRDIVFNEVLKPVFRIIPPSIGHSEWLNVAFALAKMFGADDGQARQLFIDWSRQENSKWVGAKTPEYTWDSIRNRDDDQSVGFGTIIEYARREGYEHLLWHELFRVLDLPIEPKELAPKEVVSIADRQHIYSRGFIARCALIRRFFKPQWLALRAVLKDYKGKEGKKCCNINEFEQLVASVALPGAEEISDKRGPVDRLLEIAKDELRFLQTEDRDGVAVHDRENFLIRSKAFRIHLRSMCSKQGLVLSKEAISTGIEELEGIARNSDIVKTRLRTGTHEGKHYIDLCDRERRIVEIDKEGWRIVDQCPIVFIRKDGMLALPLPETGRLEEGVRHLRWLLRADANPAGFVLGMSWALWSMQEAIVYMNLGIFGGSGNAKSSFIRFLRDIIDPHKLPLRSPSKNERDIWIALNQQAIYVLDNTSSKKPLADEVQNTFCRALTGGGRGDKTNYTDDDETIISVCKPTAMTGINNCIGNPDLHGRTVYIEMPPLSKEEAQMNESTIERRHNDNRALALGALLDIFVYGLKSLEDHSSEGDIRMKDFAQFAKACEGAYGNNGDFVRYFKEGASSAARELLMSQFVFEVLVRTLSSGFKADDRSFKWEGSVSALLALMNKFLEDNNVRKGERYFPKAPNALSRWLRASMPAMNKMGGCVLDLGRSNEGSEISIEIDRGVKELFVDCDIVKY